MFMFFYFLLFKFHPFILACPLFHYFMKAFLIVMLNYSLLLTLIVSGPLGSGLLVYYLLDSLSLFIDVQLTLQNESRVVWQAGSSGWDKHV